MGARFRASRTPSPGLPARPRPGARPALTGEAAGATAVGCAAVHSWRARCAGARAAGPRHHDEAGTADIDTAQICQPAETRNGSAGGCGDRARAGHRALTEAERRFVRLRQASC